MKTATELWSYRFLIWNLAQRDLRARYKKSLLGWLWSLINPAATLLTLTLVFGIFLGGVAPPSANDQTYFALYLWAGFSAWNFFSGTVNGSIGSLQATGGLLNKVYFPPVCPAIANMLTVLTQTAVEFGLLLVAMIAIGNVQWQIIFFPLFIVVFAMFSLGVGMFVSIFNVFYRDVGYLVSIALNLLFYATPIIYSVQTLPFFAAHPAVVTAINCNPLTQFIGFSRWMFWNASSPGLNWHWLLYTLVVSFGAFFVGAWVFTRKARDVGEEL